jgi:hypothetical protein
VTPRSRRGAFRRLGASGPEGLPLSESRRRRLALEAAWTEAVGPVLAAKVRCEGVRGAVLTVQAPDPAWADAVRRLLPRIAGRLAGRPGAPPVRRIRIRVEGRAAAQTEALPASPAANEPTPAPTRAPAGGDAESRLRAVALRLLSRGDPGGTR